MVSSGSASAWRVFLGMRRELMARALAAAAGMAERYRELV